jgi:hypothetical protein
MEGPPVATVTASTSRSLFDDDRLEVPPARLSDRRFYDSDLLNSALDLV